MREHLKPEGTNKEQDLLVLTEYLHEIMQAFETIGLDANGGVTRLGYSKVEDEMHETFLNLCDAFGFLTWEDEVGNHFCSVDGAREGKVLIASHLDSVINGGKFDGVLGVAVALATLRTLQERGKGIVVGALRCEESSNFRKDCLGSSMVTGIFKETDLSRTNRDGETLESVLRSRGYNPFMATKPKVDSYLEVHIEQGRVLEAEQLQIGVVKAISGNQRLFVTWKGMAEHSGATPMGLRTDSLCAAAELISAVEQIGKCHAPDQGVATVGEIQNHPNAINVVPGETKLSIDLRSTSVALIAQMHEETLTAIETIRKERNIEVEIEEITPTLPAQMDEDIIRQLTDACETLNISHKVMPSGAGHDAMKFAHVMPTGMLFVPCLGGISHNPAEYAALEDGARAVQVLVEVLTRGENHADSKR